MKQLLLLILLPFFHFASSAQEKEVVGKITVFENIPVVKAKIQVKSSGKEFLSDTAGLFTLQCENKDRITISAGGFQKQVVRIDDATGFVIVDLFLLPKAEAAELATGYGHVRDKEKLYAMSGSDSKSMNFSKYRNIYEILEANYPGVQVINGEVIVRNANSFDGFNSALLIVDGRETSAQSFAAVPTSDIARINILKDASASVYGVRGANGVVVVETKQGGK